MPGLAAWMPSIALTWRNKRARPRAGAAGRLRKQRGRCERPARSAGVGWTASTRALAMITTAPAIQLSRILFRALGVTGVLLAFAFAGWLSRAASVVAETETSGSIAGVSVRTVVSSPRSRDVGPFALRRGSQRRPAAAGRDPSNPGPNHTPV